MLVFPIITLNRHINTKPAALRVINWKNWRKVLKDERPSLSLSSCWQYVCGYRFLVKHSPRFLGFWISFQFVGNDVLMQRDRTHTRKENTGELCSISPCCHRIMRWSRLNQVSLSHSLKWMFLCQEGAVLAGMESLSIL